MGGRGSNMAFMSAKHDGRERRERIVSMSKVLQYTTIRSTNVVEGPSGEGAGSRLTWHHEAAIYRETERII
jgi:hypothetical protein